MQRWYKLANEVAVLFYYDKSIPAIITRKTTQRPGQLFSDVPSHVAIYNKETELVYEFVSSGCQSRNETVLDLNEVFVDLTTPEKATDFLKSCLGIRYGWATIVDVAFCKLLPDRYLSWYKRKAKHICSWLIVATLRRGGYKIPKYVDNQIQPMTPNDVKFMLQAYPKGETLNMS